MPKKKKNVQDTPDPRLAALADLIDKEVARKEGEEESYKQTMRPLKRVTSNPLVYEFVPIARNMFSDSKSVDFGFDGAVDVPNQVIYMEELSDDDELDRDLPDDISVRSMGEFCSDEIDDDELEMLEQMEYRDDWHFLKSRIGKMKFDTLKGSSQLQNALHMDDAPSETMYDRFSNWFGFRKLIVGGLWYRRKSDTQKSKRDSLQEDPLLSVYHGKSKQTLENERESATTIAKTPQDDASNETFENARRSAAILDNESNQTLENVNGRPTSTANQRIIHNNGQAYHDTSGDEATVSEKRNAPDPRLAALANLIDKEVARKEEDDESYKQTMRPLKRVTSNPLVYEFVPMARNMFSDSKSVDFGFDGAVDVPNQVIYMEEISDDDEFDRDLPDGISVRSMGEFCSDEIEDDELEMLEQLHNRDDWHFLKSRIGKRKFDTLKGSSQLQTALHIDDAPSKTVFDRLTNWFGFRKLIGGGLWYRHKNDTQERERDSMQADSSLSVYHDTSKQTLENAHESATNIAKSTQDNASNQTSENVDERLTTTASRLIKQNNMQALHGSSDDKAKVSKKRKCFLALFVFIALIILCLAGVFVAVYLGVYIPFLSEIIYPQLDEDGLSVSTEPLITGVVTTRVSAIPPTKTTMSTSTPKGGHNTNIVSLDDIVSVPGMSPDEYKKKYPYELAIVSADLDQLNGMIMDVPNFVVVHPPAKELSDAVGIAFYDAFTFLGFEVGAISVLAIGKLGYDIIRFEMLVFGRPQYNTGVMKWYGYTPENVFAKLSPITRRMTLLLPEILRKRKQTVVKRFYFTIGSSFMRPAHRYYISTTAVERPPSHVPDHWGGCDGISPCELIYV